MKILRSPEGTGRTEVELSEVQVPDLWFIAEYLGSLGGPRFKRASEQVLETWNLAHDLLWNLKERERMDKAQENRIHDLLGLDQIDDILRGPEGD